ncbi:histone deacetylase [Streptomyces fuscigenes]|nr:histone deacetylase [Streptomyces fuscigenes]MCF3960436.1 histone deacetylase [Streptomyces fuscigenes]
MRGARFGCYLAGGRPHGAAHTYPGCRDPRPPAASVLTRLPGALYFATESDVWTGGRAFYDPDTVLPGTPGSVWVRAHLITVEQFADVVAQEMGRAPGTGPGAELDLAEVLAAGRARLGGGRYETLVHPGSYEGAPVLTFTAPWGVRDVEPNAPAGPYLAQIAAGLVESGAGDAEAVARYLEQWPGVAGQWDVAGVAELAGSLG